MILLAAQIAAADSKPAEELAGLKKEAEAALEGLSLGEKPEATAEEQKEAHARFRKQMTDLARRALALAEAHPEAPETPEALVWIVERFERFETDVERDTAYDLLAERYLDKDALLPLIRIAWNNAGTTDHAERFLRAAVDRSPNPKVRASSCLCLGLYQKELASWVRDLNHPTRGKILEKYLDPEIVRRVRSRKPGDLKREAEAMFERVLKEFADMRPMGKDFPTLGEQAQGALFEIRHLDLGCSVPEIEGEDIDGKPMRLSDYRGKVIVITFWATWCGPCMGLVPHEKALVDRMKGRPFVLIGVNGDDDREKAKEVSAKEEITWRSFWDGGRQEGIPVKWGVRAWPTIYVVDAKGVIRDNGLEYFRDYQSTDHFKSIEALVAEAELGEKRH